MGKILKEKRVSKNSLLNNLSAIRNAEPYRNIAKLDDAKLGGMIKNEFKYQKDINLINSYNLSIKKADELLRILIRRVKLD